MKKKLVRLTEGDLHRIIKKSVNRIIKEAVHRELPLYNEYGEPMDTGGWYDDDDYNDDYDSDSLYYSRNYALRIANAVREGDFDDKLDKIISKGADEVFDLDIDTCSGDIEAIEDEAMNRKSLLDKNFAFHRGVDPSKPRGGMDTAFYVNSTYGNRNVANNVSSPALRDSYWQGKEKQEIHKMLPSVFNKKGEFRNTKKDLESRINKDVYGTAQFDKKPLHRKGSLNREL